MNEDERSMNEGSCQHKMITKDQTNNSKKSSLSTESTWCSSLTEYNYTFECITEIKNFLFSRTSLRPKVAIICGTGLGHLAELLTDTATFPYADIPNFPVSTVPGHAGRLVFGRLNDIPIMCMQGRLHYFEGYSVSVCSMPVRLFNLCGCTHLIVTNAAGGVNPSYKPGDLMIIKDHINIMGFAGNSALRGPNDLRFGPRYPTMTRAYNPKYIKIGQQIANEMGAENETHVGIEICLGGPNFETVAELKFLKLMGVDAVGMSSVHEVITARHCNMKVFAFSLITNKCPTEYDEDDEISHEDNIAIGINSQDRIATFVSRMIGKFDLED